MESANNSTAVSNNQHEQKNGLRWTQAFALAMAISAAIFPSYAYSLGALGALVTLAVWFGSALTGAVQNWIFLEMTAMFPDKPGGIAVVANEAWRKRMPLIGVITTFGYCVGWLAALSIIGVSAGALIQAQWFPLATWTFQAGSVSLGLPHTISAALLIVFWQLHRRGIHLASSLSKYLGIMLLVPIAVVSLAPLFSGEWLLQRFTSGSMGDIDTWTLVRTILAWLFVISWSSYGTEMCAAFGPEYRSLRDMRLALNSSGVYTAVVYALVAFGLGGVVSQPQALADPAGYFTSAVNLVVGKGFSDFFVLMLIVGFLMILNAAMADGSRALYGSALDGLTIRQLSVLNRYGQPGRCMMVAVLINLLLTIFVSNPLSILVTANVGYLMAIFFVLCAFVLLRRDQPERFRPVRLKNYWLPIVWFLIVYTLALLIVGMCSVDITGYGGVKEVLIAFGIILSSVVLYLYRRYVQDRADVALDMV